MRLTGIQQLVRDVVFATKRDKKMILLPISLVLLVLTGVLIFLTISGPLAPFIYPLF